MQEKFTNPKTREEFLERARTIPARGAKAVSEGLALKIKKSVGSLMEEKQFYDDVQRYHEHGVVPERYDNDKAT